MNLLKYISKWLQTSAFWFFYLLLLCGGAIYSLIKALLRFIIAVFVEPDFLWCKALQSTHVGAEEKWDIQEKLENAQTLTCIL